jgi:hypothetical protein
LYAEDRGPEYNGIWLKYTDFVHHSIATKSEVSGISLGPIIGHDGSTIGRQIEISAHTTSKMQEDTAGNLLTCNVCTS